MVKRCIYHYCRSKKDTESISLFSVPKNLELFEKWKDAVALTGKCLKKGQYLCEKHFRRAEIKDETIIKDDSGKVLFQRRLLKKLLIKGTVPTLFEKIKNENQMDNISQSGNIQEVKIETQFEDHTSECTNTYNEIEVKHELHFTTPNLLVKMDAIVENHSIPSNSNLFDLIFDGTITPLLPHTAWSFCIQQFPKAIVFAELGQLLRDNSVAPWYKKQIKLDEQLNIYIYVLNKLSPALNICKNVRTLQQLESIIFQISDIVICEGGPSILQYKNVEPRCAYKDMTGKWRHNACPITIQIGFVCKSCVSLGKTLRRHVISKRKTQESQFLLSPRQKKT